MKQISLAADASPAVDAMSEPSKESDAEAIPEPLQEPAMGRTTEEAVGEAAAEHEPESSEKLSAELETTVEPSQERASPGVACRCYNGSSLGNHRSNGSQLKSHLQKRCLNKP